MTQQEIQAASGDVAIVGMAGRFPKARSVAEFWENLRQGVECIRHWSEAELLEAGIDPRLLQDPSYVKSWGYLEGADLFDAPFFEVNPREAEITDPQIRLLLECAWETLEDAGYDPARYPGRIGVFAGSSNHTYLWTNLLADDSVLESMGIINTAIVNDKDFLATRISYKLDLKGPSMTVQTACSTSLVAVHVACQSLLSGESDMALAGGVSAPTNYKGGYMFSEGGTFSPDGHVRAFDARAKGMLGGNGMALVLLKRLEDALADGDSIRAVIKGSALNNDGVEKVSFTAPSVDGQSQVILDALQVAGVDPSTIGYVECHGTGTPLGDPIEIAALSQAWRQFTDERQWCPIGSVKTNIGHLDTAAGVAGLVKAALALQHKEIPPSLFYESSNPEIDFGKSPFFVNTALRAWGSERLPRRAAVSSLGMGGTNSHAILEEAPESPPPAPSRPRQLLVLSARTSSALDAATARLADHLEAHPELELADVAHTLRVGRHAFRRRRAVVAADRAQAVDALRRLDVKRAATDAVPPAERRVAFLFSGQGAQYPNMTRGLYESEATFRAEIDQACELLRPHLGCDLRGLLYPAPGSSSAEQEAAAVELARTRFTQPALFVVEYALARLWMSFGIEPDAMLGHSIGEYVAATLAGVFTLEQALELVAARGRLIDELPAGGAMSAVHLSEQELARHLGAGLDLAAVNAPGLCVVSGPEPALHALERRLEAQGVSTRRLHTSHAFHSKLMEPCLEAFGRAVQRAAPQEPAQRIVSCSTGTWLSAAEATDPRYWVRHLRQPVRFAAGVRTLLDEPGRILLEVGPGETLASLAKLSALEAPEVPIVPSTRHPKDASEDLAVLLLALGRLWCAGVAPDWSGFNGAERRQRVALPTYPFERQRYWIEPAGGAPGAALRKGPSAAAPAAVGRNPELAEWFYVPAWKRAAPPIGLAARAHEVPAGKRAAWLVFADQEGCATALRPALAATGRPVVEVYAGQAFRRDSAHVFALAPGDETGYRRLLGELDAAGLHPSDVAYLWGVDPLERHSLAGVEALQETCFFGLLFLAQALSPLQDAGTVRVVVVTRGMQDVQGGGPVAPEKALVLGPCKALDTEFPRVSCRSVDLDPALPLESLAPRLWTEFASGAAEPVVALHGAQRWVLEYEPFVLPAGDPSAHPRLRRGGTYLVTGGLGGLGLTFAEYLARTQRAQLVLTTRSGLPPRETWDEWLAQHGAAERTSRQIAKVRALEELGAQVFVGAADAADLEAMRAVVAAARARFGRIEGVVHAAGVAGAGIIELKDRATALEVLAPKVRGTRVLEAVLADDAPDFVVLCSSIASATRAMGQIDYFAANAYLDAYARHRQGLPGADGRTLTVAVNWDAWQEVGMAVETEIPAAMRAARDAAVKLGIAPAEGCEALRRILGTDEPQVLVSARELTLREDFHGRPPLHGAPAAAEAEEAAADAAAPAAHAGRAVRPRPELSVRYTAAADGTESAVSRVWADLLGLERVGRDDNLFELGGNSLIMMQLNVRLRALFGLSLPIRELFDLPEVGLLAERIDAIRAVSAARDGHEPAEEFEEFTL